MEPSTNQYRPPPEFIRSDRPAIRKGTVASGFWSIGFQATTTAARSAEKVAHLENGRARKAIHSMPRRFCGCPWTSATVHRMSYATQLRDRPSSTTGTLLLKRTLGQSIDTATNIRLVSAPAAPASPTRKLFHLRSNRHPRRCGSQSQPARRKCKYESEDATPEATA